MTSMFTLLGEKRVRSTTPPPGDAAVAVDGALSGPIQEALKNILPTIITEVVTKVVEQLVPNLTAPFKQVSDRLDQITLSIADSHRATAELRQAQETIRALQELHSNEINRLLSRQEGLERQWKAPNAILYNVNEVPRDSLTEVKSLISGGVPSENNGIIECHRLGRPNSQAQRPRPILIKFATVEQKHAAFKHAKQLRLNGITMDDDLTPAQRATRKERTAEAIALRNAGWRVFWRGDRLFKVKEGGAPTLVPLSHSRLGGGVVLGQAGGISGSSPPLGGLGEGVASPGPTSASGPTPPGDHA
eukprot:jgi/Botrbrau1/22069/Bobra.0638s0002.1